MNDSEYQKLLERNKEIAHREFPNLLQKHGLYDPAHPNKKYFCIAHDDRNKPNMSYNPKNNRLQCFTCGFCEDIFGYIGKVKGITDKKEQFRETFKELGLTMGKEPSFTGSQSYEFTAPQSQMPKPKEQTDYSEYLAACADRTDPRHYLENRGISAEVAQRFGIGFDPAFKAGKNFTWQAVIIPTNKEKTSFVARNTDPDTGKDYRYQKRGETSCLNLQTLDEQNNHAPIWLAEGEIDALSIIEAGGRAIGLGSTSSVNRFIAELKKHAPDAFSFILALDTDDAGRKASETLIEYFKSAGVRFFGMPSFLADSGTKDVNEYLMTHGEAELRENRIEAENECTTARHNDYSDYMASVCNSAFMNAFIQSLDEENECIPTGLRGLDTLLDGGLYEGLYVIGAQPAAGKTALVLQISDNIARGDGSELRAHDVLYFSLEMSRFELIARSVSRTTFELGLKHHIPRKYWKSARGIQIKERREHYCDAEKKLINDALTEYWTSVAPRVCMYEGTADFGTAFIRNAVIEHIKKTNRRPVVVIDYLQIIPQESDGKALTEKQHMDRVILELKRISREFHLPVLAISSLNRGSYESVSLSSYKESGAVEFTADVAIGLERDNIQREKGKPVPIVVKVLKNRHGMRDTKLTLNFFGEFSAFEDVGAITSVYD
jgi:replicative DNA helicase